MAYKSNTGIHSARDRDVLMGDDTVIPEGFYTDKDAFSLTPTPYADGEKPVYTPNEYGDALIKRRQAREAIGKPVLTTSANNRISVLPVGSSEYNQAIDKLDHSSMVKQLHDLYGGKDGRFDLTKLSDDALEMLLNRTKMQEDEIRGAAGMMGTGMNIPDEYLAGGEDPLSDERLKDTKKGYQKEELLGHLFQALTDTASCAANELQEMHWNIRGIQFDTMHLVLDKLYNEMNDDCDKLAEITAQYADIVKGRMTAASRVEIPEVSEATDLQSVVVAINTLLDYCLEVYGHAFNAVSKITQCPISIGAANFLQTRIEFWSKERHYFNKHRGLNV